MYREVQGVRGFFYSGAGRRKLNEEKGLIEKVKYGALNEQEFISSGLFLPGEIGLQIDLAKDNGSYTNIALRNPDDIAHLFRQLRVGSVESLNKLPKTKRRVLIYKGQNELNYGFSIKGR